MNTILVTGVAGFIGFHTSKRLLERGAAVVGIDNLNDYYDVELKKARLALLQAHENFTFYRVSMENREEIHRIFKTVSADSVVNLAAQPGVRYSLTHPYSYIDSNIVGFLNILEACRHHKIKHLVFASSSSVYGANTRMPFSVHHNVDHPVSLYAATKKANELMAHAYASLYQIPSTGLRFFTVYGPWGRPDMAYFSFTKAIMEGTPIDVFNNGLMQRDFTYIDDIVDGIVRVLAKIPEPNKDWRADHPDPGTSYAPYRIYNIGNNNSVQLMRFIEVLEDCIGRKAIKNFLPMQAGDVVATYADVDDLVRDAGFKPSTPIEKGLGEFVSWYTAYYENNGDIGKRQRATRSEANRPIP